MEMLKQLKQPDSHKAVNLWKALLILSGWLGEKPIVRYFRTIRINGNVVAGSNPAVPNHINHMVKTININNIGDKNE